MYSIHRLFKHTCFTFLRSLQDINQSYIKYTENALLIYDDDNDSNSNIIVVVVVNDDDDNDFENEEKVQL